MAEACIPVYLALRTDPTDDDASNNLYGNQTSVHDVRQRLHVANSVRKYQVMLTLGTGNTPLADHRRSDAAAAPFAARRPTRRPDDIKAVGTLPHVNQPDPEIDVRPTQAAQL